MHFRFPEELRCFDSFFEYVDRSIYSAEDILFFHLSDEDFLMIRKDGKIVYFGEVIADSFIDFMRNIYDRTECQKNQNKKAQESDISAQ